MKGNNKKEGRTQERKEAGKDRRSQVKREEGRRKLGRKGGKEGL